MSNINIRERRKYFKREARALLKYNYVKQVFMTAITVLVSFGLKTIKLKLITFLSLEYTMSALPLEMAFDLSLILITLPMYIGIIYVDAGLFEGENLPVGGMFQYFLSASNLIDCYRFILSVGLRLCAFILPFFFFGTMIAGGRQALTQIFPGSITADVIMVCISVVYIAVFAVCTVIMTRYFAAAFIFVKNPCLSVYDIIKKSSQLMKHNKIEAVKLMLSFTALSVFSHYLAGALFIFLTLPYIMLSYTSFMSYLLIQKEKDGEFLSPSNDYIDFTGDDIENPRRLDDSLSDLAAAFENIKNPFDIIDIDENYDVTGEFSNSQDLCDTDVMSRNTRIT